MPLADTTPTGVESIDGIGELISGAGERLTGLLSIKDPGWAVTKVMGLSRFALGSCQRGYLRRTRAVVS